MSRSETELQEMLWAAHRLPNGPAKFAAIDEVIAHADAQGLADFALNTRMEATSVFHHGGDPQRAFVAFTAALAAVDADPGRYGRHQRSLLWHFKWMVAALPQFPQVPLGRAEAVLDDMTRRYQLAGHGLHAVHQHRLFVAMHVGDQETADRSYEMMRRAGRDSMSDCRGCVPSTEVRYLTLSGRDVEALEVGEEALPWARCTEQPQWLLTEMVLPYLRQGRLAEAADAHQRAYRLLRGNRHYLEQLGVHLEFCARTGNELRGLDIVQRHLTWLDEPSSPYAELEFAGGAALVLRTLRDAGHGGLAVFRRGRPDTDVASLADELTARARELAARFDGRNGTTAQSDRLAARLTARPVAAVPLTPVDQARQRQQGPPGDPPVRMPQDPAALLDAAITALRRDDGPRVAAALRRFDELVPAPTGLLAARRRDVAGRVAANADDTRAAIEAFEAAAAGYAVLAEETRRQATLSRLGQLVCEDRFEEGMALLDTAIEALRADPAEGADARLRRAGALGRAGRPADALAAADAAAPTDALARSHQQRLRALCLAELGRGQEALEAADGALAELRSIGNPPVTATVQIVRSRLLPDPAARIAALRDAVRRSRAGQTTLAARMLLADELLESGTPAPAATELVEVVAHLVGSGAGPHVTAFARVRLAEALTAADAGEAALEAGEEALAAAHRSADSDLVHRARMLLVHLYTGSGDRAAAAALVDDALDDAAPDDHRRRAALLEWSADLTVDLAAADTRYGAAADAYAAAGAELDEVRARRKRLAQRGQAEATEQWLSEAAALRARSDEPEAAANDLMVAHALAAAGDDAAALRRLDGLAARLDGEEAGRARLLEARLLHRSGRSDEAVSVAREVVRGHGGRIGIDAADFLEDLLYELDRDDEAAKVWEDLHHAG